MLNTFEISIASKFHSLCIFISVSVCLYTYLCVCMYVCIFLNFHFQYDWPFFLRQHTPKEVKLLKSEAVHNFRKLPLKCFVVFVSQSCLTLCDPMGCSPPGSSVMEFFRKNTGAGSHSILQGIFQA